MDNSPKRKDQAGQGKVRTSFRMLSVGLICDWKVASKSGRESPKGRKAAPFYARLWRQDKASTSGSAIIIED